MVGTDAPLTIEGLGFHYRARDDWAIQDVNLSLAQGELLLVAGASGCGKTNWRAALTA